MILQDYTEKMKRSVLMSWLGLSSSTYYYKGKEGKPGRKPSTHTLYNEQLVENSQVVTQIKSIITGPYNAYGYQNVTAELRDLG